MADQLKDLAVVERAPMVEGKSMFLILARGKAPTPSRPAVQREPAPVAT
jgi:hypothetical protein